MYIYIRSHAYIYAYTYAHTCIHTYIQTYGVVVASRGQDTAIYTLCVAVCCSVLQCCCNVYIPCHWRLKRRRHCNMHMNFECCSVLQYVAVCCSVVATSTYRAIGASRGKVTAICMCTFCVAVRCSVLQCVAVCCSVLQFRCNVYIPCHRRRKRRRHCTMHVLCCSVLQCVAVCCSVLQCVAVLLQRARTVPSAPQEAKTLRCSVENATLCTCCVVVRCSMLQCVAVCCSVL